MNSNDTTKDGSLVPVARDSSLVTRSRSLATRGLESLRTLDRIVHFPSDVSVGDVYLFDRNSDVTGWLEALHPDALGQYLNHGNYGIERIGKVHGDFHVPNGKNVALTVTEKSNLPLLSSLPPDSLQGLYEVV